MKRINVPALISLTTVLVLCMAICTFLTIKYTGAVQPQPGTPQAGAAGDSATGSAGSGQHSGTDGTGGDSSIGSDDEEDGAANNSGGSANAGIGDGSGSDTDGSGASSGSGGDGAANGGSSGQTGDEEGAESGSGQTDKPATAEPHVCQYQLASRSEATCTRDGALTYQCGCGKQQVQTVASLGHQYQHTATVESTETKAGYKLYTCERCGHSYKETLPLRKPACRLELCSDSLLGKALPHAQYYDEMTQIMDRYAAKLSRQESLAAGTISLPSGSRSAFLQQYTEVYRYIAHTLPYTCQESGGEAAFLAWSPAEQYQTLEQCYARVYDILDGLEIDRTTTKWEAVCRINEYVCENRIYAYSSDIQDTELYRRSATYYSIFAEKASCHNYAILFQMLCLGAGIECHYYPSKTMNHAWNQVFFNDGSALWVDCCWNDVQYMFPNGTVVETSVENGVPAATVKKLREMYLLITTKELLQDHTM